MLLGWAPVLVMVFANAAPTGPGPWLQVSAADADCPRAADLVRAVERELGRPPFPGSDRDRPPVLCQITRQIDGWQADIEIRAPAAAPGSRRILVPGTTCGRLAPALVLTLTLALAASPAAASPAVAQISDPEMPAGLGLRDRPQVLVANWRLAGGALLSSGGLPDLAGGVALGGWRRRGPLELGLEARFDRARADRHGLSTLSGWRSSVALLPCLARGQISGCLVSRLGVLGVTGEGPRSSRVVHGGLAEAGARLAWRAGVAGQTLEAHAELALPLVRTRVRADGTTIWRAPATVATVGLALLTPE